MGRFRGSLSSWAHKRGTFHTDPGPTLRRTQRPVGCPGTPTLCAIPTAIDPHVLEAGQRPGRHARRAATETINAGAPGRWSAPLVWVDGRRDGTATILMVRSAPAGGSCGPEQRTRRPAGAYGAQLARTPAKCDALSSAFGCLHGVAPLCTLRNRCIPRDHCLRKGGEVVSAVSIGYFLMGRGNHQRLLAALCV